jgi:hypothetical protein
MSIHEKLKSRLRKKPSDFSFKELRTLLNGLGYVESQGGQTSGSRVTFFNKKLNHIIKLHRPHPGNILKNYQVKQLVDTLINQILL